MKTAEKFFTGVCIAGFAMTADAIPIEFIDTYEPGNEVDLTDAHQEWQYTHHLTHVGVDNSLETRIDNVLTPGAEYDSTIDTLTSGTLTLWFSSGDRNWQQGSFTLQLASLDPSSQSFASIVSVGGIDFDVSVISAIGDLGVTIKRTNAAGSALFDRSVLNVVGERGTAGTVPGTVAVPEPGTIALLAIGMLGIGFSRSRSRGPAVGPT